jgi:p-cumate 2,3-dioxygenase subunit beta
VSEAPEMQAAPTRAAIEDFLFHEAALLDEWRLEEWLALLTEDAAYYVPPNEAPDADHRTTLFTIADDIHRLRERVVRLLDTNAHAEHPRSRTRRLIANVRILGRDGEHLTVAANFVCWRYRRFERAREYVGACRYVLRWRDGALRIKERRVTLDAEELGGLGSVSFIL